MQLSFSNGKFVLKKFDKIPGDTWNYVGAGTYETINLKAALAFRPYSDVTTEKIFRRALTVYYPVPCLPPLSFLDSHQREGVIWILTRSRSYLAHAPGAGKTCQAIVASLIIPRPGPVLFIVPPTLTLNWQRETVRFSHLMGIGSTVSIVPLSTKQESMDWRADFIICPDSMITKDWVYTRLLKLNPKLIAVDEASRFKEPISQRSKAFYGGKINDKVYPGLFQGVRHVVFLDGSPMPNRPIELWAPCFALDPASIDYLGYFEFGHRYCGAKLNRFGQWEFKHSTNETELKNKIQKNFMHVVTEDKLKHPERRRSIVFMNQALTPELKTWEKKHLKLVKADESSSQGAIAEHRKKIGLKKVDWVARYIKERLETKRESILLFAWHREVVEDLAIQLKAFNPEIVYGGIKNEKREEIFRDFQAGKTQIIVGNIQAMGRGHNLQKAQRIVFAEYSWTDELNKQCEKRASRRGNEKAFVRCEYIVLPDSMDEVVLNSVFTKAARVTKIVG